MNEQALLLDRWANFYVITSSAAATLIGLLFVVITFAAERMQPEDIAKIRLYLTPTVVYFASVLGIAALLTFPSHTRLTATLCIGLVGVVGLVYSGSRLIGGDKKSYVEGGDLIPYAVSPFAAYGLLVLGVRGTDNPRLPARPHHRGCRHTVVARAQHPQLVVDCYRGRFHPQKAPLALVPSILYGF